MRIKRGRKYRKKSRGNPLKGPPRKTREKGKRKDEFTF